MPKTLLAANLLTMALNLGYALVAMGVGIAAYKIIDKYVFPQIDFVEEIKKGNIAAAIVSATAILFLAMILASAVR